MQATLGLGAAGQLGEQQFPSMQEGRGSKHASDARCSLGINSTTNQCRICEDVWYANLVLLTSPPTQELLTDVKWFEAGAQNYDLPVIAQVGCGGDDV
jgi:hypothetical protein